METVHAYTLAFRGRAWRVINVGGGVTEYGITDLGVTPQNERMQLTAPRVGRAGNRRMDAAAACSPFGEHRRRS